MTAGTIYRYIIVLVPLSLTALSLPAQPLMFRGQLSGWLTYDENSADKTEIGFRYLPETRIGWEISDGKAVDFAFDLNIHTSSSTGTLPGLGTNAAAKLYRFWARYYTDALEVRAGLQKINFGPAKILRSLMWFDTLDPRDPLQLTDGVTGLLVRYYFPNNSNIWTWGLAGSEELKGLEAVKSDSSKPEYGARLQLPVPMGEAGVTVHSRYTNVPDIMALLSSVFPSFASNVIENRIAIDGIWDAGAGLWFENSLSETKVNPSSSYWQNFTTLGADYTTGFGATLTLEHMFYSAGLAADNMSQAISISALMAMRGLTLLDSVTAIIFYDWTQNKAFPFVTWQRTYDNWIINTSAYSSPQLANSSFSGSGVQVLVSYNH